MKRQFIVDYLLIYCLILQLLHHSVIDLAEKNLFEDGPSFIWLKDENMICTKFKIVTEMVQDVCSLSITEDIQNDEMNENVKLLRSLLQSAS